MLSMSTNTLATQNDVKMKDERSLLFLRLNACLCVKQTLLMSLSFRWVFHSERSAVFLHSLRVFVPNEFFCSVAKMKCSSMQACSKLTPGDFKETIIHEDSLSSSLFPKSVSVRLIRSPCADQRHVPLTVLCKQMKGLCWTVYECKFEAWGCLRF